MSYEKIKGFFLFPVRRGIKAVFKIKVSKYVFRAVSCELIFGRNHAGEGKVLVYILKG
jgi:hypothetical protein